MQGNRRADTRPEIALRSELHRLGVRFRKNKRPVSSVRREADVVFARQRVAVFVDGCFWHGCPEHGVQPRTNSEYWMPKLERNRARDRETNLALKAQGWLVVRVWEHEHPAQAAARIAQILSRRSS
jgi:DNA mismatch endonuclease, patch repair protein